MPIDYKEYHPKWSLISKLIRFKRAGNKCEWCGAPNGELIYREAGEWKLAENSMECESQLLDGIKFTKVVLTVAHINHDKTNNRFNNLAALCQKCHLHHDRFEHAENRRYGRNWKKAQLKLELP